MKKEKPKTIIENGSSLMEYARNNFPKSILSRKKKSELFEIEDVITRKTFKNFIFKGDFQVIEFKKVKFKNCEFDGISGFYCSFQDCEFEECTFRNCRFSHLEFDWNSLRFFKCYFRNIEFDEGSGYAIIFEASNLTNCTFGGIIPLENLRFYQCNIDDCYFDTLAHYDENQIVFRDNEFMDLLFFECNILGTNFHRINFKNSIFHDSVLFKTGFLDCVLDNESFILTKKLKYDCYASMDFQTILQSEEIDQNLLSYYFNIKNKVNLKETISSMTTQKNFSTVFISYSFKDSEFAKKINLQLNNQGIRTFMWEKDAPAGKPLEEIMTSGISAHDKLLFIASEHSIKSKACQFELTTARKKQEASWQNVFFPITVDNFLFSVTKSQIRPIELANEYWENIEEIKRVNACDFSLFYNNTDYLEKDFENKFQKIIDGLKIGI